MDYQSGLKTVSICAGLGGVAGTALKPVFFLAMPAGKGNSGSPLGLGFGHLQDELTAPGGCHPGGTNCGI